MCSTLRLQEKEREKSLNWNLSDKQNSSEWQFLCVYATMLSLSLTLVRKIKRCSMCLNIFCIICCRHRAEESGCVFKADDNFDSLKLSAYITQTSPPRLFQSFATEDAPWEYLAVHKHKICRKMQNK